ncbi:MAG: arsenosugar biosynthesis radical SAM protein ArsS [Deltaproteobacteria bacterium]|nr:arsenosugar biosynthesis radical SAM protein ArsS [Deltaproteobacteria bacterium]
MPEQSLPETANVSLNGIIGVDPFPQTLMKNKLSLERGKTTTLQINVGLLCNQSCHHCHLSAGPNRKEIMDSETAEAVISYAQRGHFEVIDLTGGAPELNPNIFRLVEGLSPLTSRLLVRSNLTALKVTAGDILVDFYKRHGVVLIASFPTLLEGQTDSQRGSGIFKDSIEVLNKLNSLGYGQEGAGLELDLVTNPTGAFLPSSQSQAEKRFREVLQQKWGIVFNQLFSLANVPLGRFRQWLIQSGNLERYLEKLASYFNACALEGVMCKTLVSVSWDGTLYDCDFNLALGLHLGGKKIHVSEMPGPPKPGSPIAVADHCYACTAGMGFT